jgi:hypothetical protein
VRIEDRIKVGGLLTAPSVSIAFITLVQKVGAALLIVGLALSWLQSATANEKPGSVDGRKAELEVQKLQFEVAQLKRERRWSFSGPLGLVTGLITGVITTAATILVARQLLQHPIDPDRRDYEGKAATFSRPDGTLVWVKKPDESFAY